MFCLIAPSDDAIRHFLSKQSGLHFSYQDVGATAGETPRGYNADRNRILLGMGELTWQRAMEAVNNWQMFNLSWVRLCWLTTPIRVGRDVAILVHHFGFYSLNANRIVDVINENGAIKQFGFSYGTLTEHAESGEERFTIEWDRDDRVWYDILAFSRPRHLLVKIGYPFSRSLQRKFAEDSQRAMLRTVNSSQD